MVVFKAEVELSMVDSYLFCRDVMALATLEVEFL